MDQSSNLPAFPASFVGGFIRPCRLFADPFSSPVPSWGNVPEADDEVVPVAPLRQHRSQLPDDDGPCSVIRGEELMEIRRKYSISPLVELRCPSEFERAPDRGMNEIAIFEAYLEAGFRGDNSLL